MEEHGRLSNLSLLEFIVGTVEHNVGDAITENIISFLKKLFCLWIVVVEVFTHTYELGSLSGKYKCFHLKILKL